LEDTAQAKQQPIEQMERMQRALEAWQAQVAQYPALSLSLHPSPMLHLLLFNSVRATSNTAS
jgi:hypothetical protein